MNKLFSGAIFLLVFCLLMPLASCDRLLSVETDRFLSSDENQFASPNDTVFCILGILSKMQKLADRNVLAGELRADLMDVTVNSSNEIRDLNNFTLDSKTSPFSDVRDYYTVINNCNYFITKADTMVTVLGERVFKKEINAAKAIRAWTYLQLGLNHGDATYYSDPILSVNDLEKNYPLLSYPQLVDSLIEDMEEMNPLVNTTAIDWGEINGASTKFLLINPLFLLGDLYLWKASQTGNQADYESAALYYAKLIEMNKCLISKGNSVVWSDATYTGWIDSWSSLLSGTTSSPELISLMKLADSPFDGTPSKLGSMCRNFELCGSTAYQKINSDQIYCFRESTGTLKFTTGDLRTIRQFDKTITNPYLNESQMLINKYEQNIMLIYRAGLLYLRYAEAVNRAGKPNLAFAVLKKGLTASTLALIPANEISDQKPYVAVFRSEKFDNNMGIHSRGCGASEYNPLYVIPNYTRYTTVDGVQTASTDSLDLLAAKSDSINFVEGSICDELALETAFEGNRFQDLIRISDHRKDPTFLAKKVAAKHSSNYDYYLNLLSDRTKWFINPR